MNYFIIFLVLCSSLNSHPLGRHKELHNEGVPDAFLVLFDEYVSLTEDSIHGASDLEKNTIKKRQNEIIREVKTQFPKRGGDYLAVIVENVKNEAYVSRAYDFYGAAQIKSQKMIDYCRRDIGEADWDNSVVIGKIEQFTVLLDTRDQDETDFIKSLIKRMDHMEKGFYQIFLESKIKRNEGNLVKEKEGLAEQKSDDASTKSLDFAPEIETLNDVAEKGEEESNSRIDHDYYMWIILLLLGVGVASVCYIRKK